MIETYKYTHSVYKASPSPLKIETNSVTRGHAYKIEKKRSTKNQRLKFFTNRVVNDWNNLPSEVVEAPNINCFKNRLDKHWAHKMYEIPNF